ncbi:DUF397 domain-containing protein [Nonomuraea bangladeshensis]|uniref:DUF397 domain-containing protein n=1 Tax=Nonomuraea bangladeshensis TaxID=404385 RepID=UPI0031D9E743
MRRPLITYGWKHWTRTSHACSSSVKQCSGVARAEPQKRGNGASCAFGEKMYNHTATTAWRKSTFCNGADTCVEVAPLADGKVALRDAKDQDGPVLVFTPEEWAAFTAGVREGEFDLTALQVTA